MASTGVGEPVDRYVDEVTDEPETGTPLVVPAAPGARHSMPLRAAG
ncbi:hypothetical protein [Streptomyces sp. NPDC058653]